MPRTEEMKKHHICDLKVNKRLQRAEHWIKQRKTFTGIEIVQAGLATSARDLVRQLIFNGLNLVRETEISHTGARISRWSLM